MGRCTGTYTKLWTEGDLHTFAQHNALIYPPPPPTHTHTRTNTIKHSQQGSRLSSRMPSGCTQIINSPILLMLFYSLIDSERQSRTKQYILRCKVFLSWFALFFQSCLQSLSSDNETRKQLSCLLMQKSECVIPPSGRVSQALFSSFDLA